MADRVHVVTGFTSGIGRETAARLAATGATVVGVARDPGRGESTAHQIRSAGGRVDVLIADLAEMSQVRQLAAQIVERYGGVDVLVNNAGVVKFRREVTGDGLETTFATNHLAPFLLTNLLRDSLAARAPSRVVTVSSSVHGQVKQIPWDDLQSEHGSNPTAVYSLSKLFNILFTVELARRLDGTGVTANCVHPGFLHTGLGREATGTFKVFITLSRPFQKGAAAGADTVVHVATAPSLATVTGQYFANRKPATTSALAQDRESARRLWEISADLCGLDH